LSLLVHSLQPVSVKEVSMATRTNCPITRARFRSGAKPIHVKIASLEVDVEPKEFKTGSLGWGLNAKTIVEVDGVRVPVQIGLNLTVVGSKELPA